MKQLPAISATSIDKIEKALKDRKWCLCSHWGSSHGLQPGYTGGLCNSCGKQPPIQFIDPIFMPGDLFDGFSKQTYSKEELDKTFKLFKELAEKYKVPVVFEKHTVRKRDPEFITIDSIGFAFQEEN
jgi:hypothetical protein